MLIGSNVGLRFRLVHADWLSFHGLGCRWAELLGILRFFAFDAFRFRSLIAAMRLRRRSNSSALKFFGTPLASRPRD